MKFIHPRNNHPYLIIFVHGLIGGEETWIRIDGKKSVLQYLAADSQIRQFYDIALFKYDTTLLNTALKLKYYLSLISGKTIRYTRNLPIKKLADLLLSEIEIAAKNYSKIVIVAHSMGGLITKRLILQEIEKARSTKSEPKIALYITLATPHVGAELASLGKLLLSNKHIKNLAPTNDELIEMNNSWVQSASLPKRIYVRGYNDQIVPEGAGGIDAKENFPINSMDDHFSILVPTPETSHVLNAIKDACIELANQNGSTNEISRHIDVPEPPPVKYSNRRWKAIALTSLLIAASLAIYNVITNKNSVAISQKSRNFLTLIKNGEDKKKQYVIPNVLMAVDFNTVDDSTMEADIAITYNVVYLRKTRDESPFNDEYTAPDSVDLIDLTSSDSIDQTVKGEKWGFKYDANVGQNKMTMSKYKLRYPKSIHQTSSTTFWGALGRNEEIFQYQNDDGDIIGELIIMVSSSSIRLNVAEAAQGDLKNLSTRKEVPVYVPSDVDNTTYVARFYNLKPFDNAQLKITWAER